MLAVLFFIVLFYCVFALFSTLSIVIISLISWRWQIVFATSLNNGSLKKLVNQIVISKKIPSIIYLQLLVTYYIRLGIFYTPIYLFLYYSLVPLL